MRQTWMLCILILSIPISAETTVEGGVTYQVCGRYLSALLQVTCHSKYNTPDMRRRRSVSSPLEGALEKSNTVIGMLLPKEKAKAVLQFRRRVRREGVYDECCRKACTYVELRNYCAP